MMQAVFLAWLKTQACGQLKSVTPEEIFLWLNSLNRGLAEAEYRLMLLEISWLQTLTKDFFDFLSKDAV